MSLDPGTELVRLCARTVLTSEQALMIRRAAGAVTDWEGQIRRAGFHGLLPLLALHLDAAGADVPDEVLGRLRDALRRNTKRNVALTAELLAVLSALEARGIRAVPYKGPVLAAAVYSHLGLREFGDLDVLVPREQVATAAGVLVRRGYRPRFELSPSQEAALLATRYEHPFRRLADGAMVEVQWGIVPSYFGVPLDHARLWGRAEEVTIGARRVRSLRPEDLLVVLTVHGAKHLWRRLAWVCDVAELVRARRDLDWGALEREVDRLRVRRILLLGLGLARDVLGAPLPARVEAWLHEEPAVERLEAQVVDAWRRRPETWPGVIEGVGFHLRARERWGDRLRYGIGLATSTTPGDWDLLTLPSGLFPLYYPLRAIRLVAKYGWQARRRLATRRDAA
jgi:hypothetical protein